MLKKDILRKKEDFDAIYKAGRSVPDRYIVLFYRKNDLSYNRTAFLASKKVGNSIGRHRLKRQLREICRLRETELLCGCDLVIIARTRAKGRSYQELERALLRLAAVQNTKGARETT